MLILALSTIFASPLPFRSCKKDDAESESSLLLSNDVASGFYDDPKRRPVFDGTELEQKFTAKTAYERKFVWINLNNKSIHMSEHFTKERRHKEASIADITNVVKGPPNKLPTKGGGDNPDLGMTIVFRRGGGIDLHFKTKEIRDVWADTVRAIVGLDPVA